MLDLKRGRIPYDDRVHGLWQADGGDIPGCHLDHRDFPFGGHLRNDPWLDFGNLRSCRINPKKETKSPKYAKDLHRPPRDAAGDFCVASLRAVPRRMARYNCATCLTYRNTSREEYASPRERI